MIADGGCELHYNGRIRKLDHVRVLLKWYHASTHCCYSSEVERSVANVDAIKNHGW